MYFTIVIPIYSFAYFAPTIIKTLSYSAVATQLHTVSPMAAAFGLCLPTAYLSGRLRLRLPFVFFGCALLIGGFAILMHVRHAFAAKYAGLCLVAMGAFSAGPVIVCWYVMNQRGDGARSVGTAWMIGFGNTGGIVATFSFVAADAPRYRTGYSICLGAACVCVLAAVSYAGLVWRRNRKLRSAGEGEKCPEYLSS